MRIELLMLKKQSSVSMSLQFHWQVLLRAAVLAILLFSCKRGNAQELPNLPSLTPEELTLKDISAAPGVSAAILYYAVETDNTKSFETHSVRLKIFREEGRKLADVEIPYAGKEIQVEDIRARTIDPQGKVAEFTDQIFDREILKAKKFRVSAKVLTLPNVQVGTIIEYSYRLHFKEKVPDAFKHPDQYLFQSSFTYPAATWPVQQELFVRHAHFVLRQVGYEQAPRNVNIPASRFIVTKLGSRVIQHNVSLAGSQYVDKGNGILELDFSNIPAYEEEEYSPPEDAFKARVDLLYTVRYFGSDSYWVDVASRQGKDLEPFLKKSKAVEREAARLLSPSDTDETKLRKLYDRAQQIRMVSFEPQKTEKERKREELKENKNVEDVLTRGYAYANQVNLLFVALARAAGFEAYPFMVSSRKDTVFQADWPTESQLNAMVVQVRVSGGTIYLDPATKYCPFGLLPWDESDAGGVRLDAAAPARGITPGLRSGDAIKTRNAELRLSEDGTLRGKVDILYSGQEALTLRLKSRDQDEAARRKSLEDTLKDSLVQGATVNLVYTEGWQTCQDPLQATFEIEIPNFATRAGRRLVLPLGIFHANQRNPFITAKRTNPIYFSYPQEDREDIKLELPDGMRLESTPISNQSDQKAVYYELMVGTDGKTLHVNRTLRFSAYLFEAKQYQALQVFYDRILAGDSQQLSLVFRTEKASK